jgi:hypothetical protein
MKTLAAALAAALLAAGSALADPTPAANAPPRHSACFWRESIVGFAAHDDSAVYLRVGARDVYELKMFANCFDVSWLHRIALVSRSLSPDICEGPNPDLDVVVREMGVGRQRCPVSNVRKLTPAEIAALPKDARP